MFGEIEKRFAVARANIEGAFWLEAVIPKAGRWRGVNRGLYVLYQGGEDFIGGRVPFEVFAGFLQFAEEGAFGRGVLESGLGDWDAEIEFRSGVVKHTRKFPRIEKWAIRPFSRSLCFGML